VLQEAMKGSLKQITPLQSHKKSYFLFCIFST